MTMILEGFNRYFRNGRNQELWHLILVWSITLVALTLPALRWHQLVSWEDGFLMKLWDIVGVLLSILLTRQLGVAVRDVAGRALEGNTNGVETSKNVDFMTKSVGLLFLAGVILALAAAQLLTGYPFGCPYPLWVLLVLIATVIFVGVDYGIYRTATSRLGKRSLPKLTRNALKDARAKALRNLLYGDIPACLGFLLIGVYVVVLQERTIAPQEVVQSFVGGAAAMHMLFGNVVVGLSLTSEEWS